MPFRSLDLARAPSDSAERIRAVYRLDINDYRGVESLQLLIDHFEAP